jgi:pimeloyl-ACP methyl ester carboxylesterase
VLVVSHRRPMPEVISTPTMGEDLATFLDADGAGSYVLVGHSMGGMVCQHLAASRDDLVGRLVLSSTVPCSDAVFAQRLRHWERLLEEQRWRAFSRDAVDASFVGLGRLWRRLLLRISGVDPFDPELVARHLALSRACREHDALRRLAAITAPALVMVGREDELTRPERARELAAAIEGARLVRIDGAGHGLPEQRGDAYVEAIRGFIDGETVGEQPGEPPERRAG